MCSLYDDLGAFMIISAVVLRKMRSVSDENCRENRNTRLIEVFCLPTDTQ